MLFDAVERCQGTVLALAREAVREHKLTGGGHLQLNIVKEFHILAEQKLHLEIVFLFRFSRKAQFVIFKVFSRVRTDDLDVGLLGEQLHQAVDFDRDTGFAQYRDVGRLNEEIHHLAVSLGHQSVPGKMADPDKLGG